MPLPPKNPSSFSVASPDKVLETTHAVAHLVNLCNQRPPDAVYLIAVYHEADACRTLRLAAGMNHLETLGVLTDSLYEEQLQGRCERG